MVASQPDEPQLPQIVNLSQVRVENVQADLVRASQTIVGQIKSEEVELQESAAASVLTDELHTQDSAIGVIITDQANLVDSIVLGVRAENVVFHGAAGVVVANNIESEDIKAAAVFTAADIHAVNIKTGILFSREVHGNVTTTLDGQTALMIGLVGGAAAGLILLAGRLLFGHKK